MYHIHYLTILTNDDNIVSFSTQHADDYEDYSISTIGNRVIVYYRVQDGGLKICSPHSTGAQHIQGQLLDLTILTIPTDPDGATVISPINTDEV